MGFLAVFGLYPSKIDFMPKIAKKRVFSSLAPLRFVTASGGGWEQEIGTPKEASRPKTGWLAPVKVKETRFPLEGII